MNWTNKYNLPDPLWNALRKSDYKKTSKYSVTQLLKSPRQVILEERYTDKIEADVSDALWRFIGSAIHDFLRKGETENDLVETRLKYKDVSGQLDFYEGSYYCIDDFKITSMWTVVYKSQYEEWQKQLSIYAALLIYNGFEVKQIRNIVIMRDWNKHNNNGLELPITIVDHELLDEIDGLPILEWVDKQVNYFEECKYLTDNELPFCSSEYRWASEDIWKVYWNESKAEKPRSEKNFTGDNSENQAKEYAEYLTERDKSKKKTYRAELIKGEQFKKCEYCSASQFCNQYLEGNK